MNTVTKYILITMLLGGPVLQQTAFAQKTLTLEEARQLAVANNNNIKMAGQNILAAKAAADGAKTSALPKLDGSVIGFYLGKPLSSLLPGYGASATLGVTQPVYAGGKIKLGVLAAGKGVEIEEAQKEVTTVDVLLNTEKAYWQAVNMQAKIGLANKYKTLLQALLTDLNNNYQAGLIYKNDVLRVQVQLNEAELNLTKAQDGLTLSNLNLAQLTGLGDTVSFTIKDSVAGSFTNTDGSLLKEATANRPEIALLRKAIEAQQLQQKMLDADTKPTVGLSFTGVGAAGKQGINPTSASNVLGTYYGLASVSIPIFDWGGRKQKIKQQSFKVAAQQTQLEETKQLITLEVQQAYLQLNQSAKSIELASVSLTQAEENLRLSNDRFKAGTITGKDVLEAQTVWEQAYSSMIDAKVGYRINEAILKKALGILK